MPMLHIKECAVAQSSRPKLPRSGHCCVPLPEWHRDDVLMFGGYVESAEAGRCTRWATAESWTYSVKQDAWKQVTYAPGPSPEERLVSQAVVVQDAMWVIGGWNPGMKQDGGRILADIWKLDLHTYQWQLVRTQGQQFPPSSRFQAAAVGPLIYIHTHRNLEDIWVLDTSTDPPSLLTKMVQGEDGSTPSSRGLHSLSLVGEQLYLFGGAGHRGGMMCDLWRLDLPSLSWKQLTPKGPAPSASCAHAAAVEGRYIIYFGGAFYGPGGLEVTDALSMLDTQENKWLLPKHTAPLPAARNAAPMVNTNGKLLLHGGWRAFIETYDDTFVLDLEEQQG